MTIAQKALAITKNFCEGSPWYTDVTAYRNKLRCHRYEIDENLYFEYWGPHEWEFTVCAPLDDPKRELYIKLAMGMAAYIHSICLTFSRLPSVIAL